MRHHVIVVPSDGLVSVDGEALRFAFEAPSNIHAIQWHEGMGHIEITRGNNILLTPDGYAEQIAPFVALWEAEKARLETEQKAIDAFRNTEYNSEAAKAARIREERNRRITATDYLVSVDYPLAPPQQEVVRAYRQALRDLPQQPGFPWSGDSNDPTIPWPLLDFSE